MTKVCQRCATVFEVPKVQGMRRKYCGVACRVTGELKRKAQKRMRKL